jgi:hypothetical protein
VSKRIRLHAAQVAISRWLPQTRAVSTPVDRHAGDDRILSGTSDRRGHRHGHRHQHGHVCRTPAVRRAVARAAVPEAADGQSADRSGSLQLPPLLLKAGPAGGRLRRPSSAGSGGKLTLGGVREAFYRRAPAFAITEGLWLRDHSIFVWSEIVVMTDGQGTLPTTASDGRRRLWGKVLAAVAILSLIIGIVELAKALEWPPLFSPGDELQIAKPQEGFTIRDNFSVEIEGKVHGSKQVWVIARDGSGNWYPLDNAAPIPERSIWTSTIRYEQLGSPTRDLELHAVVATSDADEELDDYTQRGNFKRGLGELPRGAESLYKIGVSVAR